MLTRALPVGSALSLACALLASSASAQDSATAGALFEKGVADMEAGQFGSACPAIEESQRLEPRPGTLFTLAECHAGWGKVASAAAQYQEYVDLVSRLTPEQQARHQARVDLARAQLTKLKPSVPTLTVVLPADAPSGTSVTRNGDALKGAALGLPLPVDPGDYVIVTHVPGAPDRETKVSLKLGEAKRVQLEVAPSAGSATPIASASAPAPAPSAESTPRAPGPRRSSGRKTAAYVVGGFGLAGIVVGSVSGILVLGKKNQVDRNCNGSSCNETGLAAADSGKKLALVSDVGFGVGIGALAVGAILWLSGGSEPTERTARWEPLLVAGPSGVSTGMQRRW